MNNKNLVLKIERPTVYDYMVEPFRKIKDRIQLQSLWKKNHSPKVGDGHPVMIIPDYFMSSKSVNFLKKGLQLNGYQPHVCKLDKSIFEGKNFERLSEEVMKVFATANRSISLIGTGIGGCYVRLLAQKHAKKIRQIILFQTPFNGFNDHKNIKLLFSFAYRGGTLGEFTKEDVAKFTAPVSLPTTMFYCKSDDTIAWETCVEKIEDEIHQNIEYQGEDWNKSFINEVYPIIFDRLQYDKTNWKKYESLEFLKT